MILTNDEAIAKKMNSAVFPGLQGGPLMHVIAAKAVAFGEALRPDFKVYARNVVANARALAESLKSKGLDIVSGGTDNHLMLVDLRPKQLTGKVAEAGARPRAHHLQQERHSVRSRKADGHLGRAARHAGRHHARLRRRGIPPDRRHDRRGARRAVAEGRRGGFAGRGRGARQGEGAGAAFSDLSGWQRRARRAMRAGGFRRCAVRSARASIRR